MRSRFAALLALVAVTGLSGASLAQAAGLDDGVNVPLCSGHGAIWIPLGGTTPSPRHECAMGCHALCGRKSLGDADDFSPDRP
jgi:hypothetical protein